MNARIERINELIKKHTNDIIFKDLSLKDGVFITIAKVDTTADLRYTRVFVSVFPEKEFSYAMKTLEKEVFQIQGKLNKRLHMRPLPKIEFRLDLTESEADKIEKILREI
ncbi:MAG: ribosome-binding factor A [Candidatus Moraniibacteriota bacterium]